MQINFEVTDQAKERILNIMAKYQPVAPKLKIGVIGGGCAGFSYTYEMIENTSEKDIEIETNGIKILIDSAAADILNGCILDFVVALGTRSFKIFRPNQEDAESCGCGNSFNL